MSMREGTRTKCPTASPLDGAAGEGQELLKSSEQQRREAQPPGARTRRHHSCLDVREGGREARGRGEDHDRCAIRIRSLRWQHCSGRRLLLLADEWGLAVNPEPVLPAGLAPSFSGQEVLVGRRCSLVVGEGGIQWTVACRRWTWGRRCASGCHSLSQAEASSSRGDGIAGRPRLQHDREEADVGREVPGDRSPQAVLSDRALRSCGRAGLGLLCPCPLASHSQQVRREEGIPGLVP